MNLIKLPIIIAGVWLLSGCAHSHTRGSVVARHSSQLVDVCLGEGEVEPGDQVSFYQVQCSGSARKDGLSDRKCSKNKVGDGTVTELFDRHFSTVKLKSDFTVEDGMVIEKQ